MIERVVSFVGIFVMVGIAYLFCPKARRANINLRTIGTGLVLVFVFAIIVLKTPARILFVWGTQAVDRLLDFTMAGSQFVFGPLATNNEATGGFIFAFQVLPTIIFFAALMSILYHIGLMPFVIRQMAKMFSKLLNASGAESFSTAADIFVGQTEAPLVIRPYLPRLTQSELHTCMVAGYATISGGVLAAYAAMLKDHVPNIAGHLIASSVMCAPAAIVIGKILMPESEQPETLGASNIALEKTSSNLLEAIAVGTSDGLKLSVNVAAMIISFLALTAMVNFGLGFLGDTVFGTSLSLERILGWIFAPIAYVIGVSFEDVPKVASLLGQKTVLNEFVAYLNMSKELANDSAWLSERSRVLASYALCGFANFASIGIQIGGYSVLAPTRRSDISGLAARAMLGGFLATCMVACMVGVLL